MGKGAERGTTVRGTLSPTTCRTVAEQSIAQLVERRCSAHTFGKKRTTLWAKRSPTRGENGGYQQLYPPTSG